MAKTPTKTKAPTQSKTLAVVSRSLHGIEPIKIKGKKDMDKATELLSRLNTFKKNVTEEKEKVTKPLNEALRAERARFKPIEDELETAIAQVRGEMTRFHTLQIEAEKKKADEAGDKAASGEVSLEDAVNETSKTVVPRKIVAESGSVSFRTDKVVNIVNLGMVPHAYMDPNKDRIKEALLAGKKVAGCELKEVQILINRRA